LFEEEITRIIDYVKDKPVFLIDDESEINGTKFINIIVRILIKHSEAFLFECKPLSSAANTEIALQTIVDAIS
jgi:hypothetical protein